MIITKVKKTTNVKFVIIIHRINNNYTKHLETEKHRKKTMEQNQKKKSVKKCIIVYCGKIYRHQIKFISS
jgi:hypothetical protein